MIKLIKMELYRLFHTFSTYVMIAVVAGITFFTFFMVNFDLELQSDDTSNFAQGFMDGLTGGEPASGESGESGVQEQEMISLVEASTEGDVDFQFGISSNVDESWVDGEIPAGNFLISQLQSGMFLLCCSIFVSLFVNAEQKNGYIKNIAGQIPGRYMLALSKFAAVAVQTAVLIAVYVLSGMIFGAVIFKERFVFGTAGAAVVLRSLAMQYLLHLAFGSLIAAVCLLTRSAAFSMTSGILLACGVFVLVSNLINRGVHALGAFAEGFDLNRYLPDYAVKMMSNESSAHQIGGFLILAVVYIAVSAAVVGAVYQKRDVR